MNKYSERRLIKLRAEEIRLVADCEILRERAKRLEPSDSERQELAYTSLWQAHVERNWK